MTIQTTDFSQYRTVITDQGYATLRYVLEKFRPEGWALEFGVHSGHSIGIIGEYMPVIGFDSFEGLPEDWREGYPKGHFAKDALTRLRPFTLDTMLVKGWFSDTIPQMVERGLPPIGLIHVDCDLYSSTRDVLFGLAEHIQPGCLIVFDEYHGYIDADQHEEKAFKEFCDAYSVIAETVAFGDAQRAFVIAAIGGDSL